MLLALAREDPAGARRDRPHRSCRTLEGGSKCSPCFEKIDSLLRGRQCDRGLRGRQRLARAGETPRLGSRAFEEIEGTLASIASVADPADAQRRLRHAIAVARDHFRKEETVLFPLAERALGVPALERLGAAWAAERGVAGG